MHNHLLENLYEFITKRMHTQFKMKNEYNQA